MAGHGVYATETPSTATVSVKVADLPKLIPNEAELGKIVGSPELVKADTFTQIMPLPPGFSFSEPKCLSVMNPGSESAYRGSQYQGVYGLADNDEQGRVVDADAVGFRSAAEAFRFTDAQTGTWKTCSGKTLTATIEDRPSVWLVGDPSRAYGALVLLRTQEGGRGFGCARGVAARANIVADVQVCGPDRDVVQQQAGRVVNAVLDKIPK